jgi:homocitrate synthase NifV
MPIKHNPVPAITLVDSTLRDGAQSPGIWFTLGAQRKILSVLSEIGIQEVEAGIPAASEYHQKEFATLLREFPSLHLISWNRLCRSDVEKSLATGCRIIHLSAPTSDTMLQLKVRWSRQQLFQRTVDLIRWCLDKDVTVFLGAEDASRTDLSFLTDYFSLAESEGVSRLRYADTVGCEHPTLVRDRIGSILKRISIPLEYHGHNDLGLAVANALAAVEGGCSLLSVTVNGIGERAGNASLAEVAGALHLCMKYTTGIDFSRLPALSRLVSYYCRRSLPPDKPLVGSLVFTHESGIHIDGLVKDPRMYTFVDPSLVGRTHRFVVGRNSGKKGVQTILQAMGFHFSEETIEKIFNLIKNPHVFPQLRGRPERLTKIVDLVLNKEQPAYGAISKCM